MTPTPTSGAADMLELIEAYAEARQRQGHSSYNAQTSAALQAVKDALAAGQATAAPAQPAAQQPHRSGCTAGTDEECVQRGCASNCPAVSPRQGVAYAALPTSSYAGRVYEEGFLIGTCPLYTADQLHAFADATHALRASHGQAPAGAGEPTEQQILEAAFAPAQPAAEVSRFGSPELQAMIIARCVEKDQADREQEDAARKQGEKQ